MSSQISGLQLTLSPSKPYQSLKLQKIQTSSSLIGPIHPACQQKVEGEGVEEEPGMEEEDEEGGALEGPWKQQDWGTPGGTTMRPGATGKREAPITG